jgi:hypothetical protein
MSSPPKNITSVWFYLRAGENRYGRKERIAHQEQGVITSMGTITEITTAYRRELHRNLDYAINKMNKNLK